MEMQHKTMPVNFRFTDKTPRQKPLYCIKREMLIPTYQ